MKRAFAFILFLSLTSGQLLADGGFFWPNEFKRLGNSADSPSQRAIIMHNGETERMIVQVKYRGQAADFSWLIPVPALPKAEDIKTTTTVIFDDLYEMTQPSVRFSTSVRGQSKSGEAGPTETQSYENLFIQIWEQMKVGPYAVTTISATSNSVLVDWLNNNGYQFPESAAEVIDFYIQKNWHFVAIKVDVQIEESISTAQSLLPLEMTFLSQEAVFPLKISSISAAPNSEILVYVIDLERTKCNYNTVELSGKRLEQDLIDWNQQVTNPGMSCSCKDPVRPQDYDYEDFFRRELAVYNEPTFIVEAVQNVWYHDLISFFSLDDDDDQPLLVTRFRSILNPEEMTQDMSFTADPGKNDYLKVYIHFMLTDATQTDFKYYALLLGGIIVLPFHFRRKWRHKYVRKGWLVLFIILMIF